MPELETYKVSVTVECEVSGSAETASDFIRPVTNAVRDGLLPTPGDCFTFSNVVITDVSASKSPRRAGR